MTHHNVDNGSNAKALKAGLDQAETDMTAKSVRYLPDRDAIEIVISGNSGFLIPGQWIDGLEDVPVADPFNLALWPDGSAIDLAEDFGSQSTVREALNGKREISTRRARALATRFGVSPAVFI